MAIHAARLYGKDVFVWLSMDMAGTNVRVLTVCICALHPLFKGKSSIMDLQDSSIVWRM